MRPPRRDRRPAGEPGADRTDVGWAPPLYVLEATDRLKAAVGLLETWKAERGARATAARLAMRAATLLLDTTRGDGDAA